MFLPEEQSARLIQSQTVLRLSDGLQGLLPQLQSSNTGRFSFFGDDGLGLDHSDDSSPLSTAQEPQRDADGGLAGLKALFSDPPLETESWGGFVPVPVWRFLKGLLGWCWQKNKVTSLTDCRYVGGVVSYYYRSDDDVIRDSELQSWINEVIVFGRLGDENKGFPKSFTSATDLTYFVTMVIFNASAQHAAVNDAQLDYFGWMPNAPVGLLRPPPACRGRCSERSLLDSFPDVDATVHGLATVYLLSKKPADFVPLGGSKQQLFTESVPMEMAACFRSDLKRLSCDIAARNVGLKLPYVYLDPAAVEDSVTR
ncbi:hydroperoxide isomerase ALOXE3-like [Micropterus salmoides]|uniref:hydroperoxide isomerase ALOXE3-like n=1 Tax=Micropterus salmoides TaxID=27706 RepID=UPI0018EAF7AD|nr:hydroperoxide isomerase ALOXE3-like [Micropterus salmoides]